MRNTVWKGIGILTLVAAAAAGVFVLYASRYTLTDRILPGVMIDEFPAGGLSRAEALDHLREVVGGGAPAAGSRERVARLVHGDRVWEIPLPPEPGPDLEAGVDAALRAGRSGGPVRKALTFLGIRLHGHRIRLATPARPPVDLAPALEQVATDLYRDPGETRWDPEAAQWQIGPQGRELDFEGTLAALEAAVARGQRRVEAVVRPVPPRLSAQSLEQAARNVVARYETPILQAYEGRVTNIALAAKKISGVMIQPGETFSFNAAVGPRTPELGWQAAKELYQGEYIMGYGGGICQVSSTLYNAALLGGMEVVERRHHSRPLSYVPLGQDATVAWNYLDFKFRNTGETPVVVAAGVQGANPQKIVVTLYGGWKAPPARLESVTEQYLPPEYDEVPDPTLPANRRVVIDPGHEGYRVQVFRVNGAERELVARAYYQPKNGKVLVGTGGMRLEPAEQQTRMQ